MTYFLTFYMKKKVSQRENVTLKQNITLGPKYRELKTECHKMCIYLKCHFFLFVAKLLK